MKNHFFNSGFFNKGYHTGSSSQDLYRHFPINSALNDRNLTQMSSPINTGKQKDKNMFSKDYVNELKQMYEKEKEELVKKNLAVSTNLERLKSSFNDQLYLLQKQLADLKCKSNNELVKLSEEKDMELLKIRSNFEENEREYLNRLDLLSAKLREKEALLERVMIDKETEKQELTSEINNLDMRLQSLLKENLQTTKSLENENMLLKKDAQYEKESITKHYEGIISNISLDFDRKLNENNKIILGYQEKIKELETSLV